jgi:hypothetical protein
MKRFYLLDTISDNNGKKLAESDNIVDHDQVDLLQGKVRWDNPVFKAKKGFQQFDFLETELPAILLCSQRVIQALTGHSITGWASTPVTVIEKGSGNKVTYHLLHVTKKSGPFNYAASEVISKQHAFVEIKGRYFDATGTDGVDIFFVEKTIMKFVTDRFKDLAEKEKFTNVTFTSNDEVVGSIPNNIYQ